MYLHALSILACYTGHRVCMAESYHAYAWVSHWPGLSLWDWNICCSWTKGIQ